MAGRSKVRSGPGRSAGVPAALAIAGIAATNVGCGLILGIEPVSLDTSGTGGQGPTGAGGAGGGVSSAGGASSSSSDSSSDSSSNGSTGAGGGVCAPGATESCYSGPPDTEGVGLCKAGTRTCDPDGDGWGPCAGEITPAAEDCATAAAESCAAKTCGDPIWKASFGPAGDQHPLGMAVDAAGNLIVVGYFTGTVDFGGGPLSSDGSADVFVVKLGPAGDHLWSRHFGGALSDIAQAVATTPSGEVIVTGSFQGSVDFGGGLLKTKGGDDVFVVQLDGSGGHVWSQRFGGSADDVGRGIAVGAAGEVVFTGAFQGTAVFGGGMLISAGGDDVFVVKLDAAGNHLWSKRFGNIETDVGNGVALDAAGDVVLTGAFRKQVNFGGGAIGLASGNQEDVFLVKLDPVGNHLWSKRFGDVGSDRGLGVTVDAAGDIAVVGAFQSSIVFGDMILPGAGGDDAFAAKFDAEGDHLWSRAFGGPGADVALAVAAHPSGGVLFTGRFADTVDFGGGALVSGGGDDVFLARLAPDGGHVWSRRFGDAADQVGQAVALDPGAATVVLTGSFSGAVDFGGKLQSAGGEDIFLARLAL